VIRLLAAALTAALLPGCGLLKLEADNTEPPTPLVELEPRVQVETLWSRSGGSGTANQDVELVPAVEAGRVYVAGRRGDVSAFDIEGGRPVWETDTDAPIAGGPGVGDALVLVGTSEGNVLALDEETGELRWQAQVSSEVMAAPQARAGVAVARTVDGRLFGLNSDTGQRLWTYDRGVPVLTLRGTAAPVIDRDIVLNGFDGGRLVALALQNGKPLWDTRVTVPRGRSELERMVDMDSAPVVVDEAVYVASYQGSVASIDLFSGRVLWQRDMSSHAGLAVDAQNVYVTDEQDHVWALDRYTSASVWRQTKLQARGVTAPAVIGDYLVVGDKEGYLHWLDRQDGQFVARTRVDSAGISAVPVVVGDTVYIYGNSGTLAALRAE